jgi:hypothetical protein
MALTPNEILALFTQASAITNNDQFLIYSAAGIGGNNAVKVTAETVRAYLGGLAEVTIGEDGYWYIGGVNTGVKAEAGTVQFERRNDGIYYSTDGGTTYQVFAYYTDFRNAQVSAQTLTTVSIRPNVLNVWGSVQSLTITFIAGDVNDENEYKLQFQVGGNNFQLNLPSGVTWVNEPEWTNGYIYQVSILNNLAIYAGWEAASS